MLPKVSYIKRVLAWVIDWSCIFTIASIAAVAAIVALSSEDGRAFGFGLLIFSPIIVITFALWNSVFRQGKTGQTVGKQLLGTKLVSTESGNPVGAGWAFGRVIVAWALNVFTGGLFAIVDLLFPLFDPQGQRVVDKMVKTQVMSVRSEDKTSGLEMPPPSSISISSMYG